MPAGAQGTGWRPDLPSQGTALVCARKAASRRLPRTPGILEVCHLAASAAQIPFLRRGGERPPGGGGGGGGDLLPDACKADSMKGLAGHVATCAPVDRLRTNGLSLQMMAGPVTVSGSRLPRQPCQGVSGLHAASPVLKWQNGNRGGGGGGGDSTLIMTPRPTCKTISSLHAVPLMLKWQN